MVGRVELDLVEAAEVEAVHAAGGDAAGPQRLDGQHAGRALAVGAGHADHRHLLGGVPVEGGRRHAERVPGVVDHRRGHAVGDVDLALEQERAGAGGHRVRDQGVGVGAHAADGDEEGARGHLARVLGDAGDLGVELAPGQPP